MEKELEIGKKWNKPYEHDQQRMNDMLKWFLLIFIIPKAAVNLNFYQRKQ